jgi:hypothetical protein
LNDTANTAPDSGSVPRRRSLPARLFRVAVYLGLGFIVFILLLAGFTETTTFKTFLRDVIVETADSSLNARLTIENIDGNLISGWSLQGVRLRDDNGPIASIDNIILRYDLIGLLWKRITIRELTLDHPDISITKGGGRDWNINTLFKPSEDDDSTSAPFDWRVVVQNLRIVSGRLLVYDSTLTGGVPRDRMDYARMQLRDLTLALSAEYGPALKKISLNQFSFLNVLGDVNVRNIAGDIVVRPTGADVQGLSLQTDRSAIILSAAIENVDVFGSFDTDAMQDYPLAVHARAPQFDARDLQYFLPALDFLGGEAVLEVRAKGSLRELYVSKVMLEAYDSRVELNGMLRDILEGTGMWMDLTGNDVRIKGTDVPLILPGIPIMDLSEIGTAEFATLRFTGQPLTFVGEIDVATDAGQAAGKMVFGFEGSEITYDGVLKTRNVDFSRLMLDPMLSTSITGETSIRGRGVSLGSMRAMLKMRLDSSRYQRLPIRRMLLDIDVRQDSLDVNLDFASGAGSLIADGALSFEQDSITGFRLTARGLKLDLQPLMDDEDYESDLTFVLQAHGDGLDLSTMSTRVEVAVEPSRLGSLVIERDTVTLALRQHKGAPEQLLIETQYADLRVDGLFDFPRFFEYLSLQTDSLAAALSSWGMLPDSLSLPGIDLVAPAKARAAVRVPLPPPRDTARFMDVEYTLTLKRPERIARYFDASTFIVRGNYTGRIAGGYNGFDLEGQARVSDFYYVDSTRTWLAAGVRFNYDVRDLRLERPLEQLTVRALISAGDANINGLRLNRCEATLSYIDGEPRVRLRGSLDTLLDVDIDCKGRFSGGVTEFEFSTVKLAWLGEQLANDAPALVRIDSSGIAIEHFDLLHKRIRFSLKGKRDADGTNAFSLFVDSLDIGLLEYALTGSAPALRGESFSGIGFIEANVSGSDDEPQFAAAVYVDSLGYRGSLFGVLNMEARYAERNLELYSELDYSDGKGASEKVFFLSGMIPMVITFGDTEESSTSQANLRVQMKQFPLALIEEFIGLFSPLEGHANGDISITGTAEAPSFTGAITVEDGKGRFLFNNMDYGLTLRIEAEKQDIRIAEAAIRNVPSDWSEGVITAEGTISTESFAISNFDLAMRGRLKVLRPASRAATRSLYGDLFISTGGRDLAYRGRLDRSLLLGDIVIEEGALVFPYEQKGGPVARYSDFTYVIVDDTTTQLTSSLSSGRSISRSLMQPDNGLNGQVPQVPERSVLDGLSYDMKIATSGRLKVEIPISMMQAELIAVLHFDNLKVSNFGGREGRFVGEVQLGQESDVLFLGRRMTASGSLRFTRDPQNPDLDLTAVYSDYYTNPATDVRRQIFVKVFITGTKEKPELKYDMRWDEPDGTPVSQGGDIESDAFSFVLFGVFAKDLTESGKARSAAIDMAPDLASKVGSALASTAATQFLADAGLQDVINRLDFADLGTQDSRVKFTSSIGRALITYDGKMSNLGSSNVTVDFPLSRILGLPWGNFVVQIARRTIDQSTESATQIQEFSIFELKILQRFSF